MPKTRVLITVKTYPTLSQKYDELVCTAGLREDGSWVRIYPVPFRQLSYAEQYKKYQWIEVDLEKNKSDFRPESFKPRDIENPLTLLDKIPSDRDAWHERRKIVLQKVYDDMEALIAESKDKSVGTSLCVFKPTKIVDFVWEAEERDWPQDKLEKMKQLKLFEAEREGQFQVVKKLPYKFSYIFKDRTGKSRKMMIEDWETGQLYWNCLQRHQHDEKKACQDVKKKYFDDFALTKDLYFFLGTTLQFHLVAPNPFIIIGTFHPKPIGQMPLF